MVDQSTTPAVATDNPGKGLGIASFVLSLVNLGLIGLILGIIGLIKSKKAGFSNGFAIAGIIISSIGIILTTIFLIFTVAVGTEVVNKCDGLGAGAQTTVQGAVVNCDDYK